MKQHCFGERVGQHAQKADHCTHDFHPAQPPEAALTCTGSNGTRVCRGTADAKGNTCVDGQLAETNMMLVNKTLQTGAMRCWARGACRFWENRAWLGDGAATPTRPGRRSGTIHRGRRHARKTLP